MLTLPADLDFQDHFPLDELTAPGQAAAREEMAGAADAFVPKRPMDIVAWAESGKIRLPRITSPRLGRLRLIGWQKGMLRTLQEKGPEIIAFMGVPRIGKSTIIAIGMSYFSAHEGDDVIFYERSDNTAQSFHDTFLFPIMEISPGFEGLIREDGRGGKIEDKWYDRFLRNGAAIRMRSAASNGAFRQIKGRKIFCDEVGDPVWMPGQEGDKIPLALKRAQNYIDGSLFAASSPTEAETCQIARLWNQSGKRQCFVPCPHCDELQILLPKVGEKEGPGLKYKIDPETRGVVDVWYEGACGCVIRESSKRGMLDNGSWEATATPLKPGVVRFHLWAIHSLDFRSSWRRIAEAHLE